MGIGYTFAMSTPNTSKDSRHLTAFAWLVIGFGAAPRLREYVHGRNLWADEAVLAHNILSRSYSELFAPFGDSLAPPGYLALTKACIDVLGSTEHAVRLLPFLAALATLPLTFYVARRLFSYGPALIALVLVSCCNQLIVYSNEVRPYSLDAALALGILAVTLRYSERPRLVQGSWLAGIGAIAVWLSFPAIFVLAAAGLYLVSKPETRQWKTLALIGVGWLLSFAALYAVFIRPVASDTQTMTLMREFYEYGAAFMPFPPTTAAEWRWFSYALTHYADVPLSLTSDRVGAGLTVFVLAVLLVGASLLVVRQPRAALLVIGPIALALVGSAFERYPFYGRTILWTAPLAFLTMAFGIGWLLQNRYAFVRIGAVGVVAVIIALPAYRAARTVVQPVRHHELGAVLAYGEEHWAEGEYLYLRKHEAMAYAFCEDEFAFPAGRVVYAGGGREAHELPRVWIPVYYDFPGQVAHLFEELDTWGEVIEEHHARGASVYLYEFSNAAP